MKLTHVVAIVVLTVTSIPLANAQPAVPAPAKAMAPAKADTSLASGEIMNVYPKDKKVLLKHGPIPSLDMGPMTMEYRLKDAKMAKDLKKGDKVRFSAVQAKGDYVVTHIEVVK